MTDTNQPIGSVVVTDATVNDLVIDDPKRPWKMVGAFLTPLVLMLINFFTDASDGGTTITGSEWTTLATTCVLTAAATFGLSNPKTLKA